MMTNTGRSFYPGHDDGDTVHTNNGRGSCVKCGADLAGRSDLHFTADPPPPGSLAALQAKARALASGQVKTVMLTASDKFVTLNPPVNDQAARAAQRAIEGSLTKDQVAIVRERSKQSIAIALFRTDPRVHAHLLMDPANDDAQTMDEAMLQMWKSDNFGWRAEAVARAAKMVEILGAAPRST